MSTLFLLIVVIVTQQGVVEVFQGEHNYTTLFACEISGNQMTKDLATKTRYAVTGCVPVPISLINTL
jgi:hypothetical protein